jgi:hypothetical protein
MSLCPVVGKCAAPADEADHKYVLRGWIDAAQGMRAVGSPIRKQISGQGAEFVSTACRRASVALAELL